MKLLLDTHTFLWYYSGHSELNENIKQLLSSSQNEFWISMVSFWEISIKHSIGKLDLDKSFEEFCQDVMKQGFQVLPLELVHFVKANQLPFHHRDPFDRVLVSQALSEEMNFVSKDILLDLYFENENCSRIW